MARLMLIVGDMQVSVQPVPGSVSGQLLHLNLPDDHPLMAGDHEVVFYETGIGPGAKDNCVSAVMGENDALLLVSAWLQVDAGPAFYEQVEVALKAAFGEQDIRWLLP